jgi:hypothetical protein
LGPAQLPVPLSQSEGLVLSSEPGFERFYRAIADKLGSDLPTVDFAVYSHEVAVFESEYASHKATFVEASRSLSEGVEIVRNPTALCISSEQFVKLGLENQLAQVLAAFPSSVHHDRVFESMAVRTALTSGRVDIVHIAAFICPRSGALYFSAVDLRSGRPDPNTKPDIITADDLASLLKMAGTRLAVITTCDSLPLAASLLSTCHVVAARDLVSSKMMAAWVEAFYRVLPQTSLSQALDVAIKASGAPMRLFARQPDRVDLRVEQSALAVVD